MNSQDGKSRAYEFELKLAEEGSNYDPGDDTVFAVDYVFANCTFEAGAQGGARAIGNGVFLVTSGIDPVGLEVVDTAGNSKSHAYQNGTQALYDPFISILARQSEQQLII